MASILNCSINAKLLLVAGLSCFSPGRSQSTPVSLHDPLLRISILPARVSTQKAPLKTVVVARVANGVYATLDWHSMGNAQAAAVPTSAAHTAHSVRLYAATHKRSFRKHTATDSPRGPDMAFDFPSAFAIKRVRMYGMGDGMERDT
jgi:hypothetical protein